ncbi:hypothetical protein [Streptomyces sp. NPDC088789]|uniref:hypothetical protein n=1 Tax=Streptomyces sp. NPDC088789 TaxID=3365899 RepID=UPI0038027F4A
MDMREAADLLLAATDARRVTLGKRWKQVYQEAGLTHQTLNRWRNGYPVEPLTERALERALHWAPGARAAIAAGQKPEPVDEVEVSSTQAQQPRPALSAQEEALRVVVRAAAEGLQLAPDRMDQIMDAVRRDLHGAEEASADAPIESDAPPSIPSRTDFSDMVRVARAEARMSLEAVAARTEDAGTGERVVEADWLNRLERAALDPSEYPEHQQLDALVDVLHLDPGLVQEAAGIQFVGVHTTWNEEGTVRAIILGEVSEEDQAKLANLMRLYSRAPHPSGD